MNKAVFIDRDGCIAEDIGFVHKIKNFKLIPNAVEGLRLLKNYKLIIVTNQSGIGRGYFRFEDFLQYNNRVVEELRKNGIKIEKTYVCPHAPDDNCECRKPKTKFLKDAEKELGIDLSKSFMIGDKKIDVEMGRNAGCKSILVLTGNGLKEKENAEADYFADDLLDAAKWIKENDNQ
ncbi:HAD family hydrolase [Candidatus Woesearchaeota archaeon]|nr:HAD family hydrolase [Candidatus Woesearchaeota archaeon]